MPHKTLDGALGLDGLFGVNNKGECVQDGENCVMRGFIICTVHQYC
jgi:hypothetical protein